MRKAPTLFFSQKTDDLVDCLINQVHGERASPLDCPTILLPSVQMKQWLLVEIAKRKKIAMGIKLLSVQEGMRFFIQNSTIPSSLELFCLIEKALKECKDPELLRYLDGKTKRIQDLSKQLASLFSSYGQFGESLFHSEKIGWQYEILQKIFVQGPWKMQVQLFADAAHGERIHCFGIDSLPPLFWEYLFRASSLSIYLFSPCTEYWDDLATDRERRSSARRLKKKNIPFKIQRELDSYLRKAPPLLANWGKLGRETLKVFDRFAVHFEEVYREIPETSLLKKVQNDLLFFRLPGEKKKQEDASIQISLTGSSRLREVEVLRDQIVHLHQLGVPFCEMSILAPDLKSYIPLIEFTFSDPEIPIPYRISELDIGAQSSFYQGLGRLMKLAFGRWEADELLALFETPAFYRKRNWKEGHLELFRDWIEKARIDWGIDETHRKNILSEFYSPKEVGDGSWQNGLDRLLDGMIYLFPEGSPLQGVEIGFDSLEELIELVLGLKADLALFRSGEETLGVWASRLSLLAEKYLFADSESEADMAALNAFRDLLKEMREVKFGLSEAPVSFASIQSFLIQPIYGQLSASQLHAVRIAPFEEGAVLPAKALFLLGMDEESFPRAHIPSSLDLLWQEKITVPERSDRDRYLFMQALFAAQEYFRISYCHLSAEEGKPVSASIVVQELINEIDCPSIVYPSFDAKRSQENIELSFWPDLSSCPDLNLPEGERIVSISDLAQFARHSWKFYLQKIETMFLNEPLEESFILQKAQLLRASLTQPLEKIFAQETLPGGLFGEALRLEIQEKSDEWSEQLKAWNIEKISSLQFQENGGTPPIEICWENRLKVRLVGEIKQICPQGFVHMGNDDIGSLLKIWPEALITSLALGTDQIFALKSGKIKKLEDPLKSLKAFLEYYFRCLAYPSPLLPDYADALLRKDANELEKKMRTQNRQLEDPIADWVLARAPTLNAEKIFEGWEKVLRESFSGLIALYPSRAKKGDAHAAV